MLSVSFTLETMQKCAGFLGNALQRNDSFGNCKFCCLFGYALFHEAIQTSWLIQPGNRSVKLVKKKVVDIILQTRELSL